MCGNCAKHVFLGLRVRDLADPAGEIEIIPADNTVLDQPVAAFRNLLFLFFSLGEFARISDRDGAGEFVGQLDLVELFFDGLSQFDIIDVAQDEQGFDDLPEGFKCLVKCMLTGIGIEPSENIRCGIFLQLDGGNQAEQIISIITDQSFIDGFVWCDFPVLIRPALGFEDVENLLAQAFDAWRKGKAE